MAVHALAVLAQDPDDGHPSAYLAGSVNTHAVVLRRVLGTLARAGLVRAREGGGGGYRLARPPSEIPLSEVYRAVEPEGPLAESPCEPNPDCPVGAGMRAAFAETAASARRAVERALDGRTVADVARRAVRRGAARTIPNPSRKAKEKRT